MYPANMRNKKSPLSQQQQQQNDHLTLDTLPDFMKNSSTSQQVKFHSAFPPLTTKVRVKSVMERAGFDVYRPPQQLQSKNRNFTAPTMQPYSNKLKPNGSTPSLGKPRAISTTMEKTTHSSPNLLSSSRPLSDKQVIDKEAYVKNRLDLFTSDDVVDTTPVVPVAPIVNRDNKPVLEGELILPNIDITNSPVIGDETDQQFDIPARRDLMDQPEEMTLPNLIVPSISDEQLYTPATKSRVTSFSSNGDGDSLDSFDRQFEADLELNEKKSSIISQHEPIPHDALNEVHEQEPAMNRLSTINPDDIYHGNGFQNDMSIIPERTMEDSDLTVLPDIQLLNGEGEMNGISESPSLNTLPRTLDDEMLEKGFMKHSVNVVDSPNLKQQQQQRMGDENSIVEQVDQLTIQHNPGEGPCRKCHEEILESEKKIWSKDHQLTGQWHRRCFGCYECGSKFSKGSSCYVFEDAPYCERHFHELNGSLCKACNRGVEGECMQNDLDEVFHFDCLRCGHCGKSVAGGDYFTFKNAIICEVDAEKIMSQLQSPTKMSANEDEKLLKRRTRIMYL